jgi:hypothetical protein
VFAAEVTVRSSDDRERYRQVMFRRRKQADDNTLPTFTVADIAADTGQSTDTVQRWIADGKLAVTGDGRVAADELARFRRMLMRGVIDKLVEDD